MPVRKNKKELWRSVFRKVMARYDEIKSVNGTQSCGGFYKSLSNEGSNGNKYNPKVVTVTASDYICDVEITARRVLNEDEHRFFKLVYLSKDKEIIELTNNGVFRKMKLTVQEKVGLAFIANKIHPFERYRRPRDLR